MKTPVVQSSSPQELQLVIAKLVREINVLRDQIVVLKTKPATTAGGSKTTKAVGSTTTGGDSIIGPRGPRGIQGAQGPQGIQGPAGNVNNHEHDQYHRSWINLVTGFSQEPTLTATIFTGQVWSYVFTTDTGTVTYYRLVPSGSDDDAFYETFDGVSVSDLIISKPLTI